MPPGSTHVLKVVPQVLEEALAKLATAQRLRLRADAAFYDGDFLSWLEDRRIQ